MKQLSLLTVLFLLFSLSSCSVFRKTKTRIETIIKIDTVLIIKKDTIPIIKEVYLYDTAYIENSLAKAKSYYDTIKKKLVLQLVGKPFELPVKIDKKVIVTKIEKVPVKVFQWKFWLLLLIIIAYIVGRYYYKYIKK